MKKLFILCFALLLLAACEKDEESMSTRPIGFDHSVTEKTDGLSVTYQYNDGVIVLDDRNLGYLEKVEADTILYFSSNTPNDMMPKVGSVINSRVTSKTPNGLGNKVISITSEGGTVKCVTTVAPLDEIFKELKWEYSAYVTDSIPEEIDNGFGKIIKPEYVYYDEKADSCVKYDQVETKASIGHKKMVSLPFEFGNKSRIGGKGAFSIGGYIHCSGDISTGTFDFSFEPMVDFTMTLFAGVAYKKNLWQDIDEYSLMKLKNVINFIVQAGPLTLRPYVDVEGYVDLSASGQIRAKFGKTFAARVGYSQKRGGYIDNTTPTGIDNNFLRSAEIDGNLGVAPRLQFNLGCGLYTRHTAIELNPYYKSPLALDLRLTGNEAGWRSGANVTFEGKVGAEGKILIDWFGKLKLSKSMNFFETTLFKYSFPLLPTINESTFSVERDMSASGLKFKAQYTISGGLLSRFYNIKPGLAVYRGGELMYVRTSNEKIGLFTSTTPHFVIDGVEQDISYTAKPVIIFNGSRHELNGIPFSSASPTAAVTDIVQTGAANGTFIHNGGEYAYEFYFYVSSFIRGSNNCKEWGIYDPNSVDTYYPNTLADGRATQYWTAWSNSPSATFTKTPYVILLNDEYKYYETNTHTLYCGTSEGASKRVKSGDNKIVFRCDSVVFTPATR